MTTCPTCHLPRPNRAEEQAYDLALRAHNAILEEVSDRIDQDVYLCLDAAAGEIHAATLHAVQARLLRLAPLAADLIDLIAGETGAEFWAWRLPDAEDEG
jgi:hypothetical protein